MGSRWNDARQRVAERAVDPPDALLAEPEVGRDHATGGVDVDEPVAVDPDQLVGRAAAVVTGDEAAEAVVRVLDGRHRCAVVVDPFDRHQLTEQVVAVVGALGADAAPSARRPSTSLR